MAMMQQMQAMQDQNKHQDNSSASQEPGAHASSDKEEDKVTEAEVV